MGPLRWPWSTPTRAPINADVAKKIDEFFTGDARLVWVVRLKGPRRVEVHEPGRPMCLAGVGEGLEAPGILAEPVRVEALYDRDAALEDALKNLLKREGYRDLDAVRAEALRRVTLAQFAAKGWGLTDAQRARLDACDDPSTLEKWVVRILTASSLDAVLA